MIITIDGPAGSGKSSTAMAAARKAGWHYLDSGALYRTFTLLYNRYHKNREKFISALENHTIEMKVVGNDTIVYLDGKPVGEMIRSAEVSDSVSEVAAMEPVRRAVNAVMRSVVREHNFIADGRDLGTVVFPDAEAKFYMVADLDARALRRFEELRRKGLDADYEVIKKNLSERDRLDASREIAPLKKPEGAVLINTTELDFDEQVDIIADAIAGLEG